MAYLCMKHAVSKRRAWAVLQIYRSSVRYKSVRPEDGNLREAMKKVAAERRRLGIPPASQRLQADPRDVAAQGIHMNQKQLRRLYHEEKLQVRKHGGRKRALGIRRPMILFGKVNERWSLDFVSDVFINGHKFRVLAIIDDFSRECLACIVDT